ncbi:MAG: hypothetical protein AVDCRST_MAG07-1970, partial [uncultured Frankineae bacterium]
AAATGVRRGRVLRQGLSAGGVPRPRLEQPAAAHPRPREDLGRLRRAPGVPVGVPRRPRLPASGGPAGAV